MSTWTCGQSTKVRYNQMEHIAELLFASRIQTFEKPHDSAYNTATFKRLNTNSGTALEIIIDVVSELTEIAYSTILLRTRKREVVVARHSIALFAKKYTNMSLSQIASVVGVKDHSTIIHACGTMEDLRETDRAIRRYLSEAEEEIKRRIDQINEKEHA